MLTFSLITVTYNAEKTLPRTLDSVLNQTYGSIEHIIVDGASTDTTGTLAIDYLQKSDEQDKGHNVKFISEHDNGLYDAMNKGLRMATGDYVCFLNAGDSLPDKDTLSELAKAVGDSETLPAVVYGQTELVDSDGKVVGKRHLTAPNKLSWKSFKNGMLVCHQAFYARRDLAQECMYDLQYRFSADFDWCIRVMKKAEAKALELKYADMTLVHYLKDGMTTENHVASLKERYRIMQHYYGWMTTFVKHIGFLFR